MRQPGKNNCRFVGIVVDVNHGNIQRLKTAVRNNLVLTSTIKHNSKQSFWCSIGHVITAIMHAAGIRSAWQIFNLIFADAGFPGDQLDVCEMGFDSHSGFPFCFINTT